MSELEIRPLNPTIGAEIHGVDLRQELDEGTVGQIRGALLKHHVIFFRRQDIDHDQHLRFGRYFGDLHIHPAAPRPDDYPELLQIHSDENSWSLRRPGTRTYWAPTPRFNNDDKRM